MVDSFNFPSVKKKISQWNCLHHVLEQKTSTLCSQKVSKGLKMFNLFSTYFLQELYDSLLYYCHNFSVFLEVGTLSIMTLKG